MPEQSRKVGNRKQLGQSSELMETFIGPRSQGSVSVAQISSPESFSDLLEVSKMTVNLNLPKFSKLTINKEQPSSHLRSTHPKSSHRRSNHLRKSHLRSSQTRSSYPKSSHLRSSLLRSSLQEAAIQGAAIRGAVIVQHPKQTIIKKVFI